MLLALWLAIRWLPPVRRLSCIAFVTCVWSVAPLGYLLSSLIAPWEALLHVTLLSIRLLHRIARAYGAHAASWPVIATDVRGRVCSGCGRRRKPGRGCGCR